MLEPSIGHSCAILDSVPVAIALVKDRHIVRANNDAHRIFGYAPNELIGLPTRSLFLEQESYERIGREAYSAIGTGRPYRCEIELLRKDGSTGWFEFNASQYGRSVDTVAAVILDITAKRALVEKLRQSEDRYRAVVEDQTEIISRFLPDGTFLFVNEVFCRLFGKTPEELIGSQWHPVAHPDDRPMIEASLRTMSADNPVVTIENRVFTAHGQMRWMQFVNRGFFAADRRLIETQSVGRDITDYKSIEHDLRQTEHRLELALSGSGLFIWDWNMADDEVFSDRRISQMLGYTPEELGRTEAWWQLVDPRDRAGVERIFAAHLQGDTEYMYSVHRLRHRDGHWVAVEMRAKMIRHDHTGAPRRLVGTLLDVTLRKRLSEEGVDLLKRIESLIRESTSGLPSAHQESAALDSLTKRERQILAMIASGMTSARIAESLGLATNTVVAHRRNLMTKLDLHSTAEVIRFAVDRGLKN